MGPQKILILSSVILAVIGYHRVACANILVIAFFSTQSHKITYMPLIERLGERGHSISVVSPIKPLKEMKNVKEIYTFDSERLLYEEDKFDPFKVKEGGQRMDPSQLINVVFQICNQSYDLPEVQALFKEKFDLIFLQPFLNECVLGLVYRLQVPFVMFTPTSSYSFTVNKIGGHLPPSFTPNFINGYPNEMTFYQRFINFGVVLLVEGFLKFLYEPRMESLYRAKLGQDIPSINEIFKNASLLLSNGHFSLVGAKPHFPDVVDVGGIHSRPVKPLPQDLEDFISQGKDGFILFSLGSSIKGEMMPDSKRTMILRVFSKLKQQVLWKWESENMADLPKNVKLSKWLPQQDLLGHKDIRLFITHCGGGSFEESIYHGVALLGIPFLGDQPQNAKKAKDHGFLVELSWSHMTEKDFSRGIQELLVNPIYRNNAKRLSALFRDRIQEPLDLGVYWIEYVLRHKGAPHLRNAGRNLTTLQYHSVDVIVTYLSLISIILFTIFSVLRFTCQKILCGLFGRPHDHDPSCFKKKTN